MVYKPNVDGVEVRELRQNASQVVRAVEEHGPVVVTVNGRDAVLMTPLRVRQRWISSSEARQYWEESEPNPEWAERSTDGAAPIPSPIRGRSCEGPARLQRAPAPHTAPRP